MDPQAALDQFNSPHTCRARRADLAEALEEWLFRGGFKPEGKLDPELVKSLADHNETKAAHAAENVNRMLAS